MSGKKLDERINDLFARGAWQSARKLLERARAKTPDDHWVLTQLGVCLYEQRRYKAALKLLLAARKIVPTCPLTLWNLAGTFDALGKHRRAVKIYSWLLDCKESSQTDPCWESQQWATALKADSVFRLGGCYRHLGKLPKAEQCYRQYLNLVLAGIEGSYSLEEVRHEIHGLRGATKGQAERELRKVQLALQGGK